MERHALKQTNGDEGSHGTNTQKMEQN